MKIFSTYFAGDSLDDKRQSCLHLFSGLFYLADAIAMGGYFFKSFTGVSTNSANIGYFISKNSILSVKIVFIF